MAKAILPIPQRLAEETRSQVAKTASVSEWLEDLKPGWAARFFPSFEHLGFKRIEGLAAMSSEELEELEEELRQRGARLVQMNQLRKAIEALATPGKENVDASYQKSPAVRAYLNYYQSPMAAYFGESDSNLKKIMDAESPLARQQVSSPSSPMLLTSLAQSAKESRHGTPQASLLDDTCNDASSKLCRESGLPCKSPMSAYFDGDHIDDFHLEPVICRRHSAPCTISSPAPCMSNAPPVQAHILSTCMIPCHMTSTARPGPPSNQLLLSPLREDDIRRHRSEPAVPHSTMCTASPKKSALRQANHHKGRHISWADEVDEKADKESPISNTSPVGDTSLLAKRVWEVSQDAQGAFVVQKALDECSNDADRWTLVSELRGHVVEATQSPHANHVLQKAISLMPPESLNFIVAELMNQGPGVIDQITRHQYGCRIIEGLISRCPLDQLQGLVECLLAEACELCVHQYGNFVMQRLFEHPASPMRFRLFQVIHANVRILGTNFYGSAVVSKAMNSGSQEEKLLLAHAMLNVNGLLAAIARYRRGKGLIDLVLTLLEGPSKDAALAQIAASPLKVPKAACRR